MALHILRPTLLIGLIVLFMRSSAQEQTSLTPDLYKIKSDFAYRFFELAGSHSFRDYEASAKGAKYDDTQCAEDLRDIWEGILRYEEWALKYADTWGRLPYGLLGGHTISMGVYEECIDAYKKFSEERELKGQYCLTRVPLLGFYDKLKKDEDNFARISYKYSQPEYFELGVCVPNSCSPTRTREVMKNVITDIYGYQGNYNDSLLVVKEDFCDIKEPIELRGIDIFAIIFFVAIVIIMILSSIYDYNMTKSGKPKKPLFTAFSVLTNAPKIFTVKKTNNPNIIHCLSGLRVFSMCWVVFGHGYMTFYELPHLNRNYFFTWTTTAFSMLVQNATLCVDTFFFMSGLLMLWGAFREMEKTKGKLNIPMMYFHRYIRLTPVVAVVILYIMSLYKYSGAGPMWMKIGTQDKRCADTWWATLLYVQNYAFPYQICISQSWYLAVDTQLYVLSPIFLIPLWKYGKKALIPIITFGILCLGCTFATFMVNDFTLFRVQDDQVDLRQRLTYYPTHTRFPTWLIGVIFGYFLYTKNRGRQIPLAKKWVITGWCTAFLVMLADLWGPYWRILPTTPDAPIIEGAFYEPLSRTSWALSIAWIVWACYNGHGGLINDFLSWSFFVGFSRLSYCMYVIHRIVQLVNGARIQHDTRFSDYDAILRWWHDFGIALTASIFATLAFESPILGIEKAIFGHGSPKPAPKKVEPTAVTAPATEQTETTPIPPLEVAEKV